MESGTVQVRTRVTAELSSLGLVAIPFVVPTAFIGGAVA